MTCVEGAGCGACGAGGCARRWLSAGRARTLVLPAVPDPDTPLQPGDTVRLMLPDGELLRAVARAYLPMLTGLLAAPALVAMIWKPGEAALLGLAVGGAVLGWLVTRRWLRPDLSAPVIARIEDVRSD